MFHDSPLALSRTCCGVHQGSARGPLHFATSTDDAAAICIDTTPHWLYCVPSRSTVTACACDLFSIKCVSVVAQVGGLLLPLGETEH